MQRVSLDSLFVARASICVLIAAAPGMLAFMAWSGALGYPAAQEPWIVAFWLATFCSGPIAAGGFCFYTAQRNNELTFYLASAGWCFVAITICLWILHVDVFVVLMLGSPVQLVLLWLSWRLVSQQQEQHR